MSDRLHKALNDLSVSNNYLQLAAQGLKDMDAETAEENFQLLLFAERAIDQARAVRRLADDVRKVAAAMKAKQDPEP